MTKNIRVEDSVAYSIYRVARLLRKHFAALATQNDFDLTPEQWFVLNKLRIGDGQTQTGLSDALGDRPNMTRILATMITKGLVVRSDDPVDRRKHRIFLTRMGRQVHDGFARIVHEDRARTFRDLNPQDVERTMQLLATLEQNVINYSESGSGE